MNDFKKWLQENDRSDRTIQTYINLIKTFISWFEGRTGSVFTAAAVTPLDMKDFKQYLITGAKNKTGGRLSPSTVNTTIEAVRTYFRFLEEQGAILKSPVAKIQKHKTQESFSAPKWLDRNEKNKLLRYIDNEEKVRKSGWMFARDRAIIYLMLYGGLRVSEVADLEINDIDLGASYVEIMNGKGGKYRKVPLVPEVVSALKEWLDVRDQKLTIEPTQKVFTSQMRVPITRDGIEQIFRKVRKDVDIRELKPHTLRHTFCHDLVAKGFSIDWIGQVAGHSDLNTTKLYTRPGEMELRDMMNSLSSHE